jgi:predicted aspartyl protease
MRRIGLIFLAVASLSLAGIGAQAEESCGLKRVMSMPMTLDRFGGVAVPMTINGQTETMLVDTGGILSMLSPQAADSLKLTRTLIAYSMLRMVGNKAVTQYVTVDSAELGGATLPRWHFLILPDGNDVTPDLAGTIAPDILQSFDVDFDFANTKLNFFSRDHCLGKVVYWTHDASQVAEVPITVTTNFQLKIPVQVDGKSVTAMIDTGTSRSHFSLETARDLFGIDTTSPNVAPVEGSSDIKRYHYAFKSLAFEGVAVSNPDLLLISDKDFFDPYHSGQDPPRVILGMDVLRNLHLYIAYREKMLYVTPASAH